MRLNEYQEAALKTAIYPDCTQMPTEIMYCTLKLCGEAGEFAEKVGKIIRDKGGVIRKEDRDALLYEQGDLLWYMANLAELLGSDLGTIAQMNIDKLASRQKRGVIGGSGDER